MLQFSSLHAFGFPVNLCIQSMENELIMLTDVLFNGKAAHVFVSLVYSVKVPLSITQIIELHPEATVLK